MSLGRNSRRPGRDKQPQKVGSGAWARVEGWKGRDTGTLVLTHTLAHTLTCGHKYRHMLTHTVICGQYTLTHFTCLSM